MSILPSQSFLLVKMRDLKTDSRIALPETLGPRHPHGHVIACGAECKFVHVGDLVLFLPQNLFMGFNEGTPDECFLLPENAVVGWYVPEKFEELYTEQ